MKIELVDGLLHAELTLFFQEKMTTLNRLVIDTGAAQTLISADAVFDVGIFASPVDELIIIWES